MRELPCLRFLMVLSMLAISTLGSAYNFFDQGLQTAVVRTDYNAANEGTSANPITMADADVLYPCSDLLLVFGCVEPTFNSLNSNSAPLYYPQALPWSFNGGNTASRFWVLSMNNESWWKHYSSSGEAINPGAPNLSLPRAEPGYGIMGFKPIIWTEGGENFYRFHLVLNHMNWVPPNPQYPLGIPYMSIGADSNRGNGGVLGYMNDQYSPSKVTWTSKVWAIAENSPPNSWASAHFIVTTAKWGGKTRMIQLALFHEGDVLEGGVWKEFHWSDPASGKNGIHSHWNWQMQESFWYPGADIAFMDAEDINTLCGFSMTRLRNVNDSAYYSVVLDDLYRCASDLNLFDAPMPYTSVPITGVHWGNEFQGKDIALWTSVHNMRMHFPPDPCPLCRTASPSQSSENVYPPIAAAPNEVPNEVSLIAERLRLTCEKSAECWQENEQYFNGNRREQLENPSIFVGTFYDLTNAVNDGN